MRLLSLSSQHQRLHWLISQASQFENDQFELQAHWARYVCVLASGFLENALVEVYSHYARSCANPVVANFVESTLGKIQNPKASRFLQTAGAFNKTWEESLGVFLSSEGRKEAIDAIMANRHLIAHGKDSGITLARMKEYLSKSIEVIEFIEQQCDIKNN